jgi:hypothetical protein
MQLHPVAVSQVQWLSLAVKDMLTTPMLPSTMGLLPASHLDENTEVSGFWL